MAGRAIFPPSICRLVLLLPLGLIGCGVPAAYGPADSYGLDFSMPQGVDVSGAVVFYVDGINARIFQEMLDAGELPGIKKYFVDRGLYAPRAVASTPSVTLVNLTSFVTGKFAGHHGITGINWFDRNRLIWRNYETIAQKNRLSGDYTSTNLYEHFPGRTTFSVFFQAHRRATKFIENPTSAAPPFVFGWYEFVDRLTLSRFNIVMDVARKRREFPAVTIAYLLAPDFRAYDYGVNSKQYRRALKHTDRQIGRVLGDLEKAKLLDKLIIALVSDHSLCQVTKHFQLEKFLRDDVGLNIASKRFWEKKPFEKRLEYYSKFSAVLYGSGERYWAICLRKPSGASSGEVSFEAWPHRPAASDLKTYPVGNEPSLLGALFGARRIRAQKKDLLSILVAQEAVDVVAHANGPNCVRVRNSSGEVEFRQPSGRGGEISYRLISGDDPLGWKETVPSRALAGEGLTGRQWLQATLETDYPDLPEQILAYFRARRAGDIAVFAAPGWDFSGKHRAGHGGVRPADMLVPVLLAGPGVPKGHVKAVRTVDVMPTLLALLGRAVPADLDGRNLIPTPTE